MSQTINKDELKKTIVFNVKSIYRKTIDEATPAMVYQAVALAVKDMIIDRWMGVRGSVARKLDEALLFTPSIIMPSLFFSASRVLRIMPKPRSNP